jgi:hypothetical protein
MKNAIPPALSHLAAAVVLLLATPAALAQTPFTYQGKLESDGSAFTGTVHVRLGLCISATEFNPFRTEIIPNVSVTGGLFTVTPATFTVADFPGAARWLQVQVSEDGGTTYTTLAPRQQVTHAPYAIFATQAGSAASVSGTIPGSQISGFMSPARLDTGTTVGTITFSPAVGAPFAVGSSNKVTNLNSDLLDGLDATAFFRSNGGTLTGTLNIPNAGTVLDFGSVTRQMIHLWGGGDFGIGVQTATLYQRSNTNFSWYVGGTHSDALLTPGGSGISAMTLSDSLLMLRPGRLNSATGQGPIRIGFGDTNVGIPYVSIGESDTDDQMDLRANKINLSKSDGGSTTVNFGTNTGQHLTLFDNGSDVYGIGVQSSTQYFRSGDHFAWYKDGSHSDTAFEPGGGGTRLMSLSSDADLALPANGALVIGNNRVENFGIGLAMRSDLVYFKNQANVTTGVINSVGDLNLTGALSTTVLTIRGGADLAEPFDMTGPEEMEPGSVVIIDEENPGKLKLSTEDHDTRVAGIISGAGGVKPGLRLHQEGVMEGDHHVALSGRVYVRADASGGSIRPGDLLTTSNNPGHAMKVTDSSKSQGAILGKAMSKLDQETGLVLVLVTLQ